MTPELLQAFMELDTETREQMALSQWLEAHAPVSHLAVECDALTSLLTPITKLVDAKRIRPETALRVMKLLLQLSRENMEAAKAAVQGAQVQ